MMKINYDLILKKNMLNVLKDILIETYDLSKILVATVKKTSDKLKGGLFGGGGGGLGGGLLGGLIGGLVSGVLAVFTKVIVGAALFMAGKWLPEKFPQFFLCL